MTPTLEHDAQIYQGALSLQAIHQLTGLPTHIVRRAIRSGRLGAVRPPGMKAWLVPEAALQKWLSAGIAQTEGQK